MAIEVIAPFLRRESTSDLRAEALAGSCGIFTGQGVLVVGGGLVKSSFSPVRIISGTGELLGHQDSQNCCGFAAVPRRQGALHVDPGVMTWCHFRRGFPLALLEKGGWEDLPEASWGFDGKYFRF